MLRLSASANDAALSMLTVARCEMHKRWEH